MPRGRSPSSMRGLSQSKVKLHGGAAKRVQLKEMGRPANFHRSTDPMMAELVANLVTGVQYNRSTQTCARLPRSRAPRAASAKPQSACTQGRPYDRLRSSSAWPPFRYVLTRRDLRAADTPQSLGVTVVRRASELERMLSRPEAGHSLRLLPVACAASAICWCPLAGQRRHSSEWHLHDWCCLHERDERGGREQPGEQSDTRMRNLPLSRPAWPPY